MPASDFQIMPTLVKIPEPEFHVLRSPDDSLAKSYASVTDNYIQKFILNFDGITDAQMLVIWNHFLARKASLESFLWKNAYIPGYVLVQLGLTTEDLTVRWVDGSFKPTVIANGWNVEISVEKEIL
jgi:phage-related protein